MLGLNPQTPLTALVITIRTALSFSQSAASNCEAGGFNKLLQ
jgi:hypothetical protein